MKNTNIITVKMHKYVGSFAEDKDVAQKLRQELLWPQMKAGKQVHLDFDKVEDMTQSFAHALLSELIRESQGEVLDVVYFKNCGETIKRIINMVVEYMQEG